MTTTFQAPETKDRAATGRTDELALSVSTAGDVSPAAVHGKAHLRRDIQGLRAVAVTLVVLYHSHVPGIRAGYVGVDVFFVISGFLITGQILREIDRTGKLNLVGFYARRMRRLFPAALLVVLVTVTVARVWGPLLQLKATATDALFTGVYAINFRLAAEGVNYQQASGPESPLQHFWSLAVEEQFYIVWPLIIVAVIMLVRRRRVLVLYVIALVAVGASLAASIVVTAQSAPTAYFSVQTRAWEFGFGALIALADAKMAQFSTRMRGIGTWFGLASVLGAAVIYDDGTPFPGWAALLPVVGCALVIAGGAGTVSPKSAALLLARKPFQFVGKLSYGWYLWHWPMLILAPAILGHDLSWIRQVEISILALWVAGITYAAVELPTQRGRLRTAPWMARGLALSSVVVLVAIVVGYTAPGVVGDGQYAAPLDLSNPSSQALAAALAEYSTIGAVPKNLTPTLSAASNDVPITETNCHLGFLQVQEGPCVYGDPAGAHTVVLFGDSHAQQWDGALDAAAKQAHWRLVSWTKAACPVADVRIVNSTLKREYSECDQWRTQMIARINALHPSLVIASQSDSVPGQMVTNEHWAEGTLATLSQLNQPGTEVIFLSDTPYPKGDVPSCVAANLSDVRKCDVARSAAYHDSALYSGRHELVASTLRSADIKVLDPINWLCSKTTCPVIVGDALVYRDDSHMTNTYSTLLGPVLLPLLTSATVPTHS